jgi:hypothetical protein
MIDIYKMGGIIAAIIILIRLKVPLSITLSASAVILGWLYRMTFAEIANGMLKTIISIENLYLILVLQLVLVFSALLKENGSMGRAIAALNRLFQDARFTVVFIPAVIGLLPVVGGAMLSAPLVAEASDELNLSRERRTFLNYWFRHVWEYTMPTFSAVFLTAGIVGISIADLVKTNIPLTGAAVLTGAYFGFKGVRPVQSAAGKVKRNVGKDGLDFVWNLMPFFLVIILTLCFDLHLLYSLVLMTLGTILLHRMKIHTLIRLSRQHLSIDLAFLIWAMMLFKEILLSSGAMVNVTGELSRMGMPQVILLVIVPAVIAFVTGYAPAMVGLSFPVLLPIIQSSQSVASSTMLALASGICAHMLSPMHPCYVMTLKYNRASMAKTYRLLVAPVMITFLTGVVFFMLA